MGPNEDREQRIHDAKMERLAREEADQAKLLAELEQAVKDGNRLADALVKSREEVAILKLQIRQNEEARQSRKARCVEKCNHPADFVCDYEDGTLHCLECLAEKWWQVEDILSRKHNVHTYWGALETIAYPERYLTKYDPVQVAKDALKEKPNHVVPLDCGCEHPGEECDCACHKAKV